MVSQNQTTTKSLIYICKIHKEKGRDRIRLSPVPTEASRRFDPQTKELIAILRTPDPLVLPVPFHIVSLLKQWIFRDQISEEDLKWEIGFLGYEYLNPIIHAFGLSSITLAHASVEKLREAKMRILLDRVKNIEVDAVEIEATGFYLWPSRSSTERIVFKAGLFNLEDIRDYAAFSEAVFIVDLYNLMKDLKIRWDIDWRY